MADFINIVTGEPYPSPLPDPVFALVGSKTTRIKRASQGDPEYQDVLVAYMFEHGYIQAGEATKGGKGSGNWGHAGRPGKRGGSADRPNFESFGGYVASRYNKKRGVWYGLYKAREAGLDEAGGKWATVCEKHNTVCNFRSKRLAMRHLPSGDWCEECMSTSEKGGPGSGNFGHSGRPGLVGGSAPAGKGVKSPSFKRWFGDSKVVNEDGTPRVLYHGTPHAGFTEFDPGLSEDMNLAYGKGVYLTEDPAAASGYARMGASWGNADTGDASGASVYPVYARIENPFDMQKVYDFEEVKRILGDDNEFLKKEIQNQRMSQQQRDEYDQEWSELEWQKNELENSDSHEEVNPDDYEDGVNDQEYKDDVQYYIKHDLKAINRRIAEIEKVFEDDQPDVRLTGKEIYEYLYKSDSDYHDAMLESTLIGGDTSGFEFKTYANEWLKELGYDGLTHVDRYNPGKRGQVHQVWIAFDPNQVKSSTGNVGAFDLNNPDITKEMRAAFAKVFKGGKGSGNFGHSGRPGKVGGSAPHSGLNGDFEWDDPDVDFRIEGSLGMRRDVWAISRNSKPIADEIEPYRVAQLKDLAVSNISNSLPDIDYNTANYFIHNWAISSNDTNIHSLMLQEAAAEEFGLELSDWQKTCSDATQALTKKRLDDSISGQQQLLERYWSQKNNVPEKRSWAIARVEDYYGRDVPHPEDVEEIRKRILEIDRHGFEYGNQDLIYQTFIDKPTARKALRVMYNRTQKVLGKLGYKPDDEIVLYRGFDFDNGKEPDTFSTVLYHGNAMESWTYSKKVAKEFGFSRLAAKIKVSDILSMPGTGFGCLGERELVILDNRKGSKVFVAETAGDREKEAGKVTEIWNNTEKNDDWIRSLPGYEAERKLYKILAARQGGRTKGGKGSGNFGHSGRPGLVGGSAPSKSGKLPNIKTAAFKRWFGRSKVVNPDGSPRVVYHGTQADFTEFRTQEEVYMLDRSLGAHFAESPDVASRFALGIYGGKTQGGQNVIDQGNVKPVYLSIQKPRVIEGDGSDQWLIEKDVVSTVYDQDGPEEFVKWMHERFAGTISDENSRKVYDSIKAGKEITKATNPSLFGGADSFTRKMAEMQGVPFSVGGYVAFQGVGGETKRRRGAEMIRKYKNILKKQGYDGMKYQNTSPSETGDINLYFPSEHYWQENKLHLDPVENRTTWIAFSPNQIKSAFNEGTFDPSNPNILKERLKAALRYGFKGGKGSGNFSHAGRPGKVGGSAPKRSGKPAKVTDSPAFKKWFGDSKVVDEKGRPMKVYHGTDSYFSTFRASEAELGKGMYFTNDRSWASEFGEHIVGAYLKIENPQYFTGDYEEFVKEPGHDGVIARQSEYAPWEYVTYAPNQIKSIQNEGNFDPDNPNIYKGGKGSGNFGHAGRPGKVGGSMPTKVPPFQPQTEYIPDKERERIEAEEEKITALGNMGGPLPFEAKPVPESAYVGSLFDLEPYNDQSNLLESIENVDSRMESLGYYLCGTDPVTGFKVVADSIDYEDDEDYGEERMALEASIFTKDGHWVGDSQITYQDGSAHIDLLQMKSEYQGNGFATRYMKHVEETLSYEGAISITLEANIDVGGYAWARMGYDFAYAEDLSNFKDRLAETYNMYYGKWPSMERMDRVQHSWDIAAFTGPDGQRIGKRTLLGTHWDAIKYTGEYSYYESEVFEDRFRGDVEYDEVLTWDIGQMYYKKFAGKGMSKQ